MHSAITKRQQGETELREANVGLEARIRELEAQLAASEERLRTLVEHAPEAMVVFDAEARCFHNCNGNALRLFGLTRDQLLRLGPADISPDFQPDGRRSSEAARGWIAQALAGRTPIFEWIHKHADGRPIPCEVRLVRLPAEGRDLVRASIIDNTEHRRRGRIQQSTYRISEAVHAAQDLQSLYARVHEIVLGLMPARNFYIAIYDAAIGLFTFPYFVDERDPAPGPRNLDSGLTGSIIRTGKPLLVNSRTQIQKLPAGVAVLDDKTTYIETGTPSAVWLGAPLSVRGQTMGVIAVQDYADDLAYGEDDMQLLAFIGEQTGLAIERKKAEEDLLKALEREKELGRLKSNFVSLVSHEFRTPLGIIMSSAEILRDYFDSLEPAERTEHLESIQRSTRRMADLMEEVLLLGRFEAGRVDFKPEWLDLCVLAGRIVDEVRSATANACPIHLEISSESRRAWTDERLFRHIFTNLLSNAVKYSDRGKLVEFTVLRQQNRAVCKVRDQGRGIPEEDREWLFRAFHRGRNVADRPGTGLGLVLVKRCVELHSGSIEVTSRLGEGSTFTVLLPLFPAPGPETALVAPNQNGPRAP
ncbi:MAG TPA: ATP-binding protein [Verrucomicrobiae bacterium]